MPSKGKIILVLDSSLEALRSYCAAHADARIVFLRGEAYAPFSQCQNTELAVLPDHLKKEINAETLDTLKSISGIKKDEVPLISRFEKERFNAWFYHRYRIYFSLCQLQYEMFLIQQFIQDSEDIEIITSGSKHARLLAKHKGIRFISLAKSPRPKPDLRYMRTFLWVLFIRSWKGLFTIRRFKKRERIFLISSSQFDQVHKQRETLRVNHFFGSILSSDEEQAMACIDFLQFPKLRGKNPLLRSKQILQSSPHLTLGSEFITFYFGFLRPTVWRELRRFSRQLKASYSALFTADTSPIQAEMLREFQALHGSTLLYYFQYLAFSRCFRHSRAKVISSIDENSPNPKSVLDAAKANGIFTVGIQHGSIHHLHPAYMYSLVDRAWKPFPDLTFLWGEHFKRLLLERSAFEEKELQVIGQPRTDLVFDAQFQSFNNWEDYVPPSPLVIVFASQPQQDTALRKRAAIEVIQASKRLVDHILVIKIHPNEDKNYYETLLNELSAQAIVVNREINLYYVLQKANIVITCFSTVGAEAVFFKKPLVILDHLQQDVLEYAARGVARQTTNEEELFTALQEFIASNGAIDSEKYSSFIEDFAFSMDGQVSKRFSESLRDRLKVLV